MLVRQLMTSSPVTVSRRTSAQTALRLMAAHDVTALPVTTRTGRVEGIVSELDLLRERAAPPRGHHLDGPRGALDPPKYVDEVMTPHVLTVREVSDVADAIELFLTSGVKSLPVVDPTDRVVGILSRADVVRAIARADDELAGEVDDLLVRAGLRDWYVEACDGVLHISGRGEDRQERLAVALARTVPGVLSVHVSTSAADQAGRHGAGR
ncbi:CBS domain-containing protein [Nocardioides bigeumensis]|uniref:CBS domain-containing protein n=1 Tax=Nocardioides bigeumensis TaxID=433657 RepID=A0ABN2Y550_9ACTN